jgi:hypothetical protein
MAGDAVGGALSSGVPGVARRETTEKDFGNGHGDVDTQTYDEADAVNSIPHANNVLLRTDEPIDRLDLSVRFHG